MEKKTLLPPGFEHTTFGVQVGRSDTSAISVNTVVEFHGEAGEIQ